MSATDKQLQALEAENQMLRTELWHTGIAIGVIAKWPRLYFNRFYVEQWAVRTRDILHRLGDKRANEILTVQGSKTIKNSRLCALRSTLESAHDQDR